MVKTHSASNAFIPRYLTAIPGAYLDDLPDDLAELLAEQERAKARKDALADDPFLERVGELMDIACDERRREFVSATQKIREAGDKAEVRCLREDLDAVRARLEGEMEKLRETNKVDRQNLATELETERNNAEQARVKSSEREKELEEELERARNEVRETKARVEEEARQAKGQLERKLERAEREAREAGKASKQWQQKAQASETALRKQVEESRTAETAAKQREAGLQQQLTSASWATEQVTEQARQAAQRQASALFDERRLRDRLVTAFGARVFLLCGDCARLKRAIKFLVGRVLKLQAKMRVKAASLAQYKVTCAGLAEKVKTMREQLMETRERRRDERTRLDQARERSLTL